MVGSARISTIARLKSSCYPVKKTKIKFVAVKLVHVPYNVDLRFGRRWWQRISESHIKRLDTGIMASIPMNTLVAVKKENFPATKLNLTISLN